MPPNATTDLVTDHEDINALMDRLDPALEAGDPEAALRQLDVLWARLGVHIRSEHLLTFEALREARPSGSDVSEGELEETHLRLREDHDLFMRELSAVAKLLKEHRGINEDAPMPAGMTDHVREHLDRVLRVLDTHTGVEEQRGYPWREKWLSPEKQEMIREQMRYQLDNVPARFALEAGSEEG